jgi:hypothetical protein
MGSIAQAKETFGVITMHLVMQPSMAQCFTASARLEPSSIGTSVNMRRAVQPLRAAPNSPRANAPTHAAAGISCGSPLPNWIDTEAVRLDSRTFRGNDTV